MDPAAGSGPPSPQSPPSPPASSSPPPSRQTLASSPAFRAASLRSEVRRAYGVLGVVALVAALVLRREALRELDPRIIGLALAGNGLLLAVQIGILAFARWARRRNRYIPGWFVITSVVLESLVPTGIVGGYIAARVLPPYVSLTSPAVLGYGVLIGLTTLRLRPALCLLAGAVSAAGYAALLAYVVYSLHATVPTTGHPREAFVSIALLILISGLAAAWVAREIRIHVEAALGEAETRRLIERMEVDLSVARSIQRALLPSAAPDIPGFDIAGWNRPADQTGGDYYDWQPLPDGNWIVTLADVSGHGIGPALVTAACRAYVRASGSSYQGDLASLTSRINQLLADDLPSGRFVTMVSVLIHPRGGSGDGSGSGSGGGGDGGGATLSLLSAGHWPVVLYLGASGKVQEILPQALPLAIDRDAPIGPAETITITEGDVLALVTDGYIEWARTSPDGSRDEFGVSRLRESLCRHAGLPAADMIQAITADAAAFARSPQQDDLTMVIIRCVAPAASRGTPLPDREPAR